MQCEKNSLLHMNIFMCVGLRCGQKFLVFSSVTLISTWQHTGSFPSSSSQSRSSSKHCDLFSEDWKKICKSGESKSDKERQKTKNTTRRKMDQCGCLITHSHTHTLSPPSLELSLSSHLSQDWIIIIIIVLLSGLPKTKQLQKLTLGAVLQITNVVVVEL